MWKTFKCEVVTSEKLLGSQPKDKEVYRTFILGKVREAAAKAGNNGEGGADIAATVAGLEEEELPTVTDVEERGWTGFPKDSEGRIILWDYQWKGFLKEAANTLKNVLGVKNMRSKVENSVFVFPRQIPIFRAGGNITEPDGVLERPLRAMTMQGPRVSLARSDYIEAGARAIFEIKLLQGSEITEKHLTELLRWGEVKGLLQWRNGGWGRFKLVRFEAG